MVSLSVAEVPSPSVVAVSMVVAMVVSGSVDSVVVGGGLVWMFDGIDSIEMLGGQKVMRLIFLAGY